jgi:hypothetical protein
MVLTNKIDYLDTRTAAATHQLTETYLYSQPNTTTLCISIKQED